MRDYRILDQNGDEFIGASTVRSCAMASGTTPKEQAERDASAMTASGEGTFRAERVKARATTPRGFTAISH